MYIDDVVTMSWTCSSTCTDLNHCSLLFASRIKIKQEIEDFLCKKRRMYKPKVSFILSVGLLPIFFESLMGAK